MNFLNKILFSFGILFLVINAFHADNFFNSPKNRLDVNNISSNFLNTGVFDQNILRLGFEWPKRSGKTAVFTAGLTLAAYINNELRMAAASYKGELAPGYIYIYNGNPIVVTDSRFRFYKVTRGDNINTNSDWTDWLNMVPFGAPYADINHNGTYEPAIDTPGVKGADQTIFICLTDGFPEEHKIDEGFGGGTPPMFAEVHLTAWAYNRTGLEDMQFVKWEIINKNVLTWNSMYSAIVSDPDLGNRNDDYIGCDTIRQLSYCYNAGNIDNIYGENPPAIGFLWLNCNQNNNDLTPKSFTFFNLNPIPPIVSCETAPFSNPLSAYLMLKGLKNDGTPWVIPNTNPPGTTKFCYSGNPETGSGWTEYIGKINNCAMLLTGEFEHPSIPGDRRIIMSSGGVGFNVPPNDTHTIIIAQLIARGTNNLNSVTKLKQLSDVAQNLCNNGFVIGVNNISTEVPNSFTLYQNYPNPFNPVTKIKFSIPPSKGARGMNTKLVVYDILGREVAVLVKEKLSPGTYEADWDASNFSSGIYFYSLITKDFTETKKMVLIK